MAQQLTASARNTLPGISGSREWWKYSEQFAIWISSPMKSFAHSYDGLPTISDTAPESNTFSHGVDTCRIDCSRANCRADPFYSCLQTSHGNSTRSIYRRLSRRQL